MTGEAQPPATPASRLTRSRKDRVIAGVAGGLGRYLGLDPVVLRIAFVVLGFTGSGIFLYLIAWFVMPEAVDEPDVPPPPAGSAGAGRVILGGALVAVGVVILLNRVVSWFDRVALPAALIAIGVAVLVYNARR